LEQRKGMRPLSDKQREYLTNLYQLIDTQLMQRESKYVIINDNLYDLLSRKKAIGDILTDGSYGFGDKNFLNELKEIYKWITT